MGASAIEAPMVGKSTETTDAHRRQTTMTPELTTTTTPVLTAVPANISVQENGAHQQTANNGDLYQHVNFGIIGGILKNVPLVEMPFSILHVCTVLYMYAYAMLFLT